MRRTIALVLAGGEGRRLYPLTRERSKPAVYFGGRYRLVDFVLSNLVNSGFMRIKVITQYRATSLVRHVARNWPIASTVLDQFIDCVPASMNLGPKWFRGTADAIWQNLDLLREARPSDVLIFGSDHIYKMDISQMLHFHRERRADLTVSVVTVPRKEATAFGCVDVDENWRVKGFLEKPKDPPHIPGNPNLSLASMGNYIFRTRRLIEELRRDAAEEETAHDFGRDILATAHQRMDVFAYDFSSQLCPGESEHSRGYWRDVGTLDSFYEANMDLIAIEPRLNLYNPQWPIRGLAASAGPAKFVFNDPNSGRMGHAHDSIVGSGSIISGGHLNRSIAFSQVRLNSFSEVTGCILFPGVDVGRGARLRKCIVDKGVRIPPGEVIGEDLEKDRQRFTVSSEGIVVVTREDLGQMDEFDQAIGEALSGN